MPRRPPGVLVPAWRVRTLTANVRAITIRQPYAWAIVKKGKRIENRGAFVAMDRLVDVVTESDDRWFEGE
jgi:hypothetical protein